jgi:hypothetical protein
MALISLAESYFRSLKRIKVIPILTKYLLQYKRVCIPHIGTFELVQQSPQLSIADKLFTPPFFTIRYLHQDAVPEHQFNFFSWSDPSRKEILKEELFNFGAELKSKIKDAPFQWNGFGTLRYASDGVIFEPHPIELDSLQRVPAEKVIRYNAEHSMLVGDQQMTRQQVTRVLHKKSSRWPSAIVLGWIIFVIALIAIIILLYLGKFQPAASGLRLGVQ